MYFELILAGSIAFLIGWSLSGIYTRWRLITYVANKLESGEWKDPTQTTEPNPAVQCINIRVEEINGELFCYQLETDMFISKAKDGQTLVNQLKDKFEGRAAPVNVKIHKEDGADYIKDFF